jgi:hypothetical protein
MLQQKQLLISTQLNPTLLPPPQHQLSPTRPQRTLSLAARMISTPRPPQRVVLPLLHRLHRLQLLLTTLRPREHLAFQRVVFGSSSSSSSNAMRMHSIGKRDSSRRTSPSISCDPFSLCPLPTAVLCIARNTTTGTIFIFVI